MTDSALVLDPLAIVLDDNGAAAGGATLDFYAAGTSTPLTVYSDAALSSSIGTSITCDANGVPSYGGNPTLIYTGATTYKVTITPGGGSTVRTYDNVRGALDTSSFAPTSASPKLPVSTHNEDVTLTASDLGKTHEGDASGGNFTFFLPTAVTATNGIETAFRNIGSSGVITIAPIAGQTIDGRVGLALADQYQAVRIVPDGANWRIVGAAPKFKETAPYFTVQDRLTAPPTSPTPGACYIINGTPTGAWSSYANKDLVIATGTGSWAKFTPATGWKAWIVDEDVESVFYDSAWTDYSNVTAPTTSALKIAVFSDEKAQNTQGGTPTANAWTKHDLQTERSNTITGASLASSVITLPTGKYMIHAQVSFYASLESQIRLRNTTDSSTIAISPQQYGSNYTSGTGPASILSSAGTVAFGYVDVTEATETIELQYYVTSAASSGLGRVRNVSSENEVYAVVTILDLTSIQGPQGAQGSQGVDGLDAAIDMAWSTATTGDPGTGKMRMDNATFASVTAIAISETTASGANIAALLATWDDSTSDNKGLVKVTEESAPQKFKAFMITGAGTDQGTYWTFPVTPVDDDGTIDNGDSIAVLHVPVGDQGIAGTTVPDISGLTDLPITSFDRTADELIVYDDSAAGHKKFFLPQLVLDATHPTFGAVGDDATSNTTALQAIIDHVESLGGGTIWIPKGTYRTGALTVTGDNIKIVGEPGTILSFPTLGSGVNGIEVTGDNFQIFDVAGKGPASAAYVLGENFIYVYGADTNNRIQKFRAERCEAYNFGFAGILGKFVDDYHVHHCHVHDCGYIGVGFISCNQARIQNNHIETITPGTSGNMYGITGTHVTTGYDLDPNVGLPTAANPFCNDCVISFNTIEDIAWEGIDFHGAYNSQVSFNRVFATKYGIAVSGSSGDAADYAGYQNLVIGNIVDGRYIDGATSGRECTGYGININGGAAFAGQVIICASNIVTYKGVISNTNVGAIQATFPWLCNVYGNVIDRWKGVAILLTQGKGACYGNTIGEHSGDNALDSAGYGIYDQSTSGEWQIYGNVLEPLTGYTANIGITQNSGGLSQVFGNRMAAAVTPYSNVVPQVDIVDQVRFGSAGATADAYIVRDAAAVLALRNSTTAQALRVYNTYTSSTDHEKAVIQWNSNVLEIGSSKGSGGGTARDIRILAGDTEVLNYSVSNTRWTSAQDFLCASGKRMHADGYWVRSSASAQVLILSNGNGVLRFFNATATDFTGFQFGGTTSSFPYLKKNGASLEIKLADDSAYAPIAASVFNAASGTVVASLPTGAVGKIARVTDANAPAVGSTVAGGGAAAALVWHNGTNWTVIGV